MAVWLRGVATRFTAVLLRGVALSVLWREFAIRFMAVLLRGVAMRFISVLLRGVALAVLWRLVAVCFMTILLRGVALTVLLRGATRVVNAQSEHLFYKRASVQKQPTRVRGNIWFRNRVWVRREKNTGRLNKTREW